MNVFNAYSLLSYTNYNVMNVNNVFNFIISVLKTTNQDDHKKIMEEIKIHLGMQFFNSFRDYIKKKYDFNHSFVQLVS